MKEILICILIFCLGIAVGFLFRWWLTHRSEEYVGTIVVRRDKITEKTVYSLELDDFPEQLTLKKMVVFKVDNSGESSGRK